jgi:hypothetical protein
VSGYQPPKKKIKNKKEENLQLALTDKEIVVGRWKLWDCLQGYRKIYRGNCRD